VPELPEVETVKRGLSPTMEGARITYLELRRANLRFPFPQDFSNSVSGQTVTSLSRRAKYLLINLENNQTIIAHLGMSGSFRVNNEALGDFHHPRTEFGKHDHVVFHFKTAKIIYNDPRRFGFMVLVETDRLHEHPLIKNIGIEPLGNQLSSSYILTLFERRKTALKAALLDQTLIAGLGNIYVCEALWRAKLSPFMPCNHLKDADLLAISIQNVLNEAIEAGGSSLRDHRQTSGEMGYFQHRFAAYDSTGQSCLHEKCSGVIKREVQNGRSTYFCDTCQVKLNRADSK
jgi:formamidopyrimidine-DNA glycosylase